MILRILLLTTLLCSPLVADAVGFTRNGLFITAESFVGNGGTSTLANGSTLTKGDDQIQIVTFGDHTVDLPDATTLKNGWFYEIINNGGSTVQVRDSAAGSVATLEGGDNVKTILLDNSTAAGVWSTRGTIFQNLSPLSSKGDLLVADGSSSFRLPGGTEGQVLRQRAAAQAGVAWEDEGIVDLASGVTGILPLINGGTGFSTKAAAFNNLSPLTTKGDILVTDGASNFRLPAGAEGQILVQRAAAGSGLSWEAPTASATNKSVTGSAGTPSAIVAGTGITGLSADILQSIFIEGSGGAVDVTANPQIEAGTTVGQILEIIAKDNTNTVKFEDGTGLSLNGPITMNLDSVLVLFWDGSNWIEFSRRN